MDKNQFTRDCTLDWHLRIALSQHTEIIVLHCWEATPHTKSSPKWWQSKPEVQRVRVDPCIITKKPPISMVVMVSSVPKFHWVQDWHSLSSILRNQMSHLSCSVMVQPIKDNCMKLPTWPNYGIYQQFISLKTICLVWEHPLTELVPILSSTLEVMLFQEFKYIHCLIIDWWKQCLLSQRDIEIRQKTLFGERSNFHWSHDI